MPDYFQPHADNDHPRAAGMFVIDPAATDRRAEVQAQLALSEAKVDASGCLDAATLTRFQTLRFAVTGAFDLPDLIGTDFTGPADFAVSDALAQALLPVVGPAIQFVPVPNMWNKTTNSPWTGAPYVFVTVRQRINGWDADKTRFYQVFDPKTHDLTAEFTQGTPVLDQNAIDGAVIWRDSRTKTLVINDAVKRILDQFATEHLFYTKLRLS